MTKPFFQQALIIESCMTLLPIVRINLLVNETGPEADPWVVENHPAGIISLTGFVCVVWPSQSIDGGVRLSSAGLK